MVFALNSELFYNSQGYFQGGVKGKLSHLRGVASSLKLIVNKKIMTEFTRTGHIVYSRSHTVSPLLDGMLPFTLYTMNQ